MKKRKYNKKCSIILLNDDVNTFDHVVISLQEICGHNYFQAIQCAHLVHHNGSCEIFKDQRELTETIYEELKEVGLVVKLK
jgi:ATP-dependent Clp protease adaptor protein ClpS|tara:strand:- start:286 stop:528 length:243 start_codon:yes stop_codon:yes gene_type:complete